MRRGLGVMAMKFHAQPVAAVKNDHHSTTRRRTRRGPILSPSQPVGISNSAYARVNAEKTIPIWLAEKLRSFEINGAAWEMQTRSMY